MRSLRSLLGASRKVIAARLDHLQSTLTALGERLRTTVAKLIGENLGALVRDTFLQALVPESTEANPRSSYTHSQTYRDQPYRDSYGQSHWNDPPERDPWRRSSDPYADDPYYEDRYDEDRYDDKPEPRQSEPQRETPAAPSRLPIAVATGFRAVAWSLRRWCGKGSVWGATALGLVTACAAYFTGSVVNIGLGLLESADHLAGCR